MAPQKIPVREDTGTLEILPKHRKSSGNLVCSSSKYLDFKDAGHCYFCCKTFNFCYVSFANEIVKEI